MIILGVDPGTVVTGYGVIESDGTRHHYLDCGAFRLPARRGLAERLGYLAGELRRVISDSRAQVLALEDLFFAVNAKSALRLAHARGVIMLCAAEGNIPIFEYTPLEVKSAVTGYGRAEKRQVQEMVRIILRLETPPSPFDAADALAIAICHAQNQSTREAIERAKLSILP